MGCGQREAAQHQSFTHADLKAFLVAHTHTCCFQGCTKLICSQSQPGIFFQELAVKHLRRLVYIILQSKRCKETKLQNAVWRIWLLTARSTMMMTLQDCRGSTQAVLFHEPQSFLQVAEKHEFSVSSSGPRSKWKKSISGRQCEKKLPAARAHEPAGSRKTWVFIDSGGPRS